LVRGVRRGLVPFLVTIVVVALATPALASSGGLGSNRHHGSPAEVKVAREVRLGQFSEAVVTLWTRCKAPFVVRELVVDLTQAGGDSGSRAGDFGIVCDGAWHRLSLSVNTPGGGPFGPGLTTVRARLTVVDPATGDPAPQAWDRITDFVHAQVEVKVSRDVRLGQGDAMLVTVFARCEHPWVPQSMTVGVSQDDGFTVGSTSVGSGIVCDDRWHDFDLQVFPSGERFHRGLTTVDASLEVLDPIDFDPVEQGTDSMTVWVNAAADVKIARHARVEAVHGTLLLPIWARCQRPWVVAELSIDVGPEATGAGGSASGDFGLVCDGRWHRVEVPVEPSPGPFLGDFVAHAFFTVLDPISFDPVDQAQDTAMIDTPFANSASNCMEEGLSSFVSAWVWMLPGELLDQVQIESQCATTYTFLTFNFEVNVVVAPGASTILGPVELTRLGVFHAPGVFVGAGTDIIGATTPCVYTSIADIDYLLEADGTLVPDPCPPT
jgi:hypothetical protein